MRSAGPRRSPCLRFSIAPARLRPIRLVEEARQTQARQPELAVDRRQDFAKIIVVDHPIGRQQVPHRPGGRVRLQGPVDRPAAGSLSRPRLAALEPAGFEPIHVGAPVPHCRMDQVAVPRQVKIARERRLAGLRADEPAQVHLNRDRVAAPLFVRPYASGWWRSPTTCTANFNASRRVFAPRPQRSALFSRSSSAMAQSPCADGAQCSAATYRSDASGMSTKCQRDVPGARRARRRPSSRRDASECRGRAGAPPRRRPAATAGAARSRRRRSGPPAPRRCA